MTGPDKVKKWNSIFGDNVQSKNKNSKASIFEKNPPQPLFGSVIARKPVEKGKVSLLIGATTRKRLDVSLSDLDSFSSDPLVKKEALKMILQTDVDKVKLEYVLSIGKDIQERHKTLAESCFNFINLSNMQSVRTKIGELLELLEEIEHPSEQNGILSKIGFLKDKSEKTFQEDLAKIEETSRSLDLSQGALSDALDICTRLEIEIKGLQDDAAPIIVMCEFFCGYEKDNFPKDLFISRLTGLLTTVNSLNSNKIQVALFKTTLVNLKETISQIILTDIPHWMSNCTDKQQKQNIINKLKTVK
jgi:hypothetical protein